MEDGELSCHLCARPYGNNVPDFVIEDQKRRSGQHAQRKKYTYHLNNRGWATYNKYGNEFMSEIGKKGGRPRSI